MTNKQLPAEVQERIKADAIKHVESTRGREGRIETYISGATAENARFQSIIDALDQFIAFHESGLLPAKHVYEKAVVARDRWKGKEAEPVKEIEYMPILSAELSELKNIPKVPKQVPMHLLNEEQADRNHGQTLRRLKERGGLGIKEALSLITCNNWSYYRDMPMKEAIAMLNDLTNPQQKSNE